MVSSFAVDPIDTRPISVISFGAHEAGAIFRPRSVAPSGPAELDNMSKNLGFQPFQMLRYYAGLVRGHDISLLLGKPVLQATLERVPLLSIAVYSMVLTLLIGISCGVTRGAQSQQMARSGSDGASPALRRVAAGFWLGLMLIILLSVHLGWLPTGGHAVADGLRGWFRTATMRTISLALLQVVARITRSTMLEVLRQDYIRAARAKVTPEFIVIAKHAFRNVMTSPSSR